jgi:hypothetical protein
LDIFTADSGRPPRAGYQRAHWLIHLVHDRAGKLAQSRQAQSVRKLGLSFGKQSLGGLPFCNVDDDSPIQEISISVRGAPLRVLFGFSPR